MHGILDKDVLLHAVEGVFSDAMLDLFFVGDIVQDLLNLFEGFRYEKDDVLAGIIEVLAKKGRNPEALDVVSMLEDGEKKDHLMRTFFTVILFQGFSAASQEST